MHVVGNSGVERILVSGEYAFEMEDVRLCFDRALSSERDT